jgi:hypothetical protein
MCKLREISDVEKGDGYYGTDCEGLLARGTLNC